MSRIVYSGTRLGTGHPLAGADGYAADDPPEFVDDCPDCDGGGSVACGKDENIRKQCPRCGGTGEVSE